MDVVSKVYCQLRIWLVLSPLSQMLEVVVCSVTEPGAASLGF